MKTVRLGAGSAAFVDMVEPAVELAERGKLDYLCYDSLAEMTTVWAAGEKTRNPNKGYDPYMEKKLRPVLPLCAKNVTSGRIRPCEQLSRKQESRHF